MTKLFSEGKKPEIATVIERMRSDGELELAGGPAYVASLTDGVAVFADGLHPQYLQIVKEKAALRRIIQVTNESMAQAYSCEESFKDISSAMDSGN